MPTGEKVDPFRGYHFIVEIHGITRASFREASGLDSKQDAIEYREGDEGPTSRKVPGMIKYSNVTLKRGITDDGDLWKWREEVAKGKHSVKDVSIVQLDEENNEKIRWNFARAWPTAWTGPSYNATSNEIAVETLEFAHEGLTRA